MQCQAHFKYWSETNITSSSNLCGNCHTPLAEMMMSKRKKRYKHCGKGNIGQKKFLVENTERCLQMIPWQTTTRVSFNQMILKKKKDEKNKT